MKKNAGKSKISYYLVLVLLFILTSALIGALVGGDYVIPFHEFNSASGELASENNDKTIHGSLGTAIANSGMSGGKYSIAVGFLSGASPGRAPSDNLNEAHAFPVPFRPSQGHTKITFTRLTSEARIRIYTISGKLVKTLEKTDTTTDEIDWYPVVNYAGENVVSGVYIFYVDESDGMHRSGKLVIIK
ncbi:T9SS type A sorting domain-containing protein [Elusimicrobiota bacterium]